MESLEAIIEEMDSTYARRDPLFGPMLDGWAVRLRAISERDAKRSIAASLSPEREEFVEAARKASILVDLYEAHIIRKYLGEQSGDALIAQCHAYRRMLEAERGKEGE